MNQKKKILIVHGYQGYPLRASIRDLLYCYDRHLENTYYFYLNLNEAFGIPSYILKINFDLIIFHTMFLSARWEGEEYFRKHIISKSLPFKKYKCPKLVLPQDEWIHTRILNEFITEIEITHIGSVAPPTEWPKIYASVDQKKIKIKQFLTGYLDDKILKLSRKIYKEWDQRSNDIGYRAFPSPPWLGKHGYLKTKIATVFSQKRITDHFIINISTQPKDTITNNKWYYFLNDCRCFIGVEGGSTVIDPDGHIWKKGTSYVQDHPNAPFEEIEKEVFPRMDGNLNLICISPRHLEAIATRTCHVLVEGSYNQILLPGKHYIEVKKDFSNLDEVIEKMKNKDYCRYLIDNAYNDIAVNETYNYKGFVQELIHFTLN